MNIKGYTANESHPPAQTAAPGLTGADFGSLFTAAVARAAAAAGSAGSAEDAQSSLEEFKSEFYRKIEAIPVHPSQSGVSQSISIAEGLFEKMRVDPELEKVILAQIQTGLSQNLVSPPAYSTMRFDENGQFSASSGTAEYMDDFEKEAADAFWRSEPSDVDRKAAKKSAKKEKEQKAEERRRMEELLTDLALQRRRNARAAEERVNGDGDYVSGPAPVIRPSVIESV